jgi:epoxyqueuosine reductase QueG
MDKNLLKEFFEKQMVPLWGVAGLTKDDSVFLPQNLQGRFTSAVVYAFPLSDAVLDLLSGGPDLLYLHHYRQVNYLLDRVGTLASELLRQNGFSGLPVPTSQIIDWKEQKGLLSLRQLATTAGLGWIGRNNLLVTPDFGSRVRLSAVLTDAPLDAGKPISFGCGKCTRCLSRCPVSAIKTEPNDFDLTACRQFIKETCSRKSIGQNICGPCLCSVKDRSLNGNA